jgi:hypothetical protein
MATYVKRLDPNHLVTIGEEGFFGDERPEAVHNPQGWGGQIGQDFVPDHMSAAIDFATIHIWPDNWQRCRPACACRLAPDPGLPASCAPHPPSASVVYRFAVNLMVAMRAVVAPP